MKIKIPPFTAMAAPAERMAVVTAETGPVEGGDPDYGGWTIFTFINPVLALHYFGERDENGLDVYEAVFMSDYNHILNTNHLHDRCDAEVVCCPWPRKDDKKRLKKVIDDLVERHRKYIERLLDKGQPAFHGVGEEEALRRRRRDPETGETNGHA